MRIQKKKKKVGTAEGPGRQSGQTPPLPTPRGSSLLERGQHANPCEKRSYRLSRSEAPQPGTASWPCCEVAPQDGRTDSREGCGTDSAWGHLSRHSNTHSWTHPPARRSPGWQECCSEGRWTVPGGPLEGRHRSEGPLRAAGCPGGGFQSRHMSLRAAARERPVFWSEPGRGRAEDISGHCDPPRNLASSQHPTPGHGARPARPLPPSSRAQPAEPHARQTGPWACSEVPGLRGRLTPDTAQPPAHTGHPRGGALLSGRG